MAIKFNHWLQMSVEDIEPGLLVHLDPKYLRRCGGKTTANTALQANEKKFFVCLGDKGFNLGFEFWLPLYGFPGTDRVEIPAECFSGHPNAAVARHYHKYQLWGANRDAVISAAIAGHDKSTPEHRNRVNLEKFPIDPTDFEGYQKLVEALAEEQLAHLNGETDYPVVIGQEVEYPNQRR